MTIVMNAPEKVGKYRVTGLIGKGVSGVVYKAVDPTSQRVVAVKTLGRFLPVAPRASQTFAARLREHAQTIARLAHPGIVTILEIDEADGRPFIAMEHVAGLNLAQWLEATPLPPQAIVLQVMNQLLDALECAHLAGVRHGDIKPGNLIVTSAGVVKVSDFGLARAENRPGGLAGVAPEYLSGRLVDHRVDIYAAGVVLYRMLVGRDPFAPGALADGSASLGATARPPSTVAEAGRTAAFDAVVARAMAHDPSQRFASAAEFREALAAAPDQRIPEHGTRLVTLGANGRGSPAAVAGAATAAMDPSLLPVSMSRPAPSGEAAAALPVLTIAIPDSVLAMPAYDPWAALAPGNGVPGGDRMDRRESQLASDTLSNDEAYVSFLDQVARERRSTVAAAAAAATAALSAAADAADLRANAAARGSKLSVLPTPAPTSGLVITGSVSAAQTPGQRALAGTAAARLAGNDLQLAHPVEGAEIPAEALRRVLRVLSSHFGSNAGDVLKQVAGRARTIAELHTLLLEIAGVTIDKKKMAKQLKAVAKLPL